MNKKIHILNVFQRWIINILALPHLPRISIFPKAEQCVNIAFVEDVFLENLDKIADLQSDKISKLLSDNITDKSSFEILTSVYQEFHGVLKIPIYVIKHQVNISQSHLSFLLFTYQIIVSNNKILFWQEWDSDSALEAFRILSNSLKDNTPVQNV